MKRLYNWMAVGTTSFLVIAGFFEYQTIRRHSELQAKLRAFLRLIDTRLRTSKEGDFEISCASAFDGTLLFFSPYSLDDLTGLSAIVGLPKAQRIKSLISDTESFNAAILGASGTIAALDISSLHLSYGGIYSTKCQLGAMLALKVRQPGYLIQLKCSENPPKDK